MSGYILSVICGFAVGITVATDRTLTRLRAEGAPVPSLAPGQWLWRRYIACMGVSVAAWIAIALYLLLSDTKEASFLIAAVVAGAAYFGFKEVEPSMQRRFASR